MVLACAFWASFVVGVDGERHVDTGDVFERPEGGFDAIFGVVLSFFSPIHTTLCG